jgi:hypothetical protein
MKHLLSILSALCAFTVVMAIMAPRHATPRKKLYVDIVRWMIFVESVLSGGYSGFLIGGIVGTFIGSIAGALFGIVIMIWYACLI